MATINLRPFHFSICKSRLSESTAEVTPRFAYTVLQFCYGTLQLNRTKSKWCIRELMRIKINCSRCKIGSKRWAGDVAKSARGNGNAIWFPPATGRRSRPVATRRTSRVARSREMVTQRIADRKVMSLNFTSLAPSTSTRVVLCSNWERSTVRYTASRMRKAMSSPASAYVCRGFELNLRCTRIERTTVTEAWNQPLAKPVKTAISSAKTHTRGLQTSSGTCCSSPHLRLLFSPSAHARDPIPSTFRFRLEELPPIKFTWPLETTTKYNRRSHSMSTSLTRLFIASEIEQRMDRPISTKYIERIDIF